MSTLFASGLFGIRGYELWIMLIGSLVCVSAGVIGCFLILRKMSLMGDAISHAVLPGIAVGAMISGEVTSWPVMLGAVIVGVLTPFLIDLLRQSGRIQEDASLGIVFTVLFSIGAIMISRMNNVHLDLDCVLFGEIATAHLDQVIIGGQPYGPRAVWVLSVVLIVDLLFVALFFKELKLMTFDEGLAEAMGIRPRVIHYMLLGLVAMTTIAAFESVGAIIVVGMLIVPGAVAYLLTDRLGVMLALAGLVGVGCAVGGYVLSVAVGGQVSIAGSMATASGLLFALAFLFSPRYGVAVRAWRRMKLSQRLSSEHLLMTLYRAHEAEEPWVTQETLFAHSLAHGPISEAAARRLMREGMLLWERRQMRLTPTGMKAAGKLVRAHRLWEAFVERELGLPPDHVHRSADDIEHFLHPELQEQLSHALEHPEEDPHGKPIP